MILAPVVVNRKGEQLELFVELRAKGFVRVRVDGKVHEIDAVPQAREEHQAHDRGRRRPAARARRPEAAARRIVRDRAAPRRRPRDRRRDGHASGEHLFSAKFACPICNYSLAELEPRLFSFNSPMGACPRCDGLGSISFFDPKRVVAFPQLSLASGAIKGWDRRNQFYFQMLQSLAKHVGFDLERPFVQLPERVQQILLYGSGDEKIPFAYLSERGKPMVREHAFEGIIPNLERRYRETDSLMVREELAKYLNSKPCPECGGTRLRREARYVKVGDGRQRARDLRDLGHAARAPRPAISSGLVLDGQKAAIADRIVKEIVSRLAFLNNVGLDYLALDRSAETLSGGESQRIRLASQIGSGPDRRDVRAGRAVDRPAPARQRPAARHAQAPARSRQQRDRRRARPRRDLVGRLHRRHGAGRGRARRPGRRAGDARGDPPRAAFADGPVSRRAPADPDARAPASRRSRRAC